MAAIGVAANASHHGGGMTARHNAVVMSMAHRWRGIASNVRRLERIAGVAMKCISCRRLAAHSRRVSSWLHVGEPSCHRMIMVNA